MKDKRVIITGASDGIGKVAAKRLTELGATVVIIGRSPDKTKAVAAELGQPYYIADFAKLEDVRKLGQQLHEKYPKIDVLINNAGGIFGERQLTVDGYEKTMQVNHLAHFLLVHILLDTLIASKATVISTSSIANSIFAKLNINDINMEHGYSPNVAYGNAKLENILFTKELNKRYGSQGISAVAFHPGNVQTNFASDTKSILRFMYQTPLRRFMRLITPEKGADTLVWLATTKPGIEWEPGQYYVKRAIARTNKLANNEDVVESLWEQSERMIRNELVL